ncbi:unnamed protein product [Hymenolepis diminuta]|uniref:Uncharacterized protein n=1 Tax=Hymenolepis diminuta TaxID=6216 RepID=A0A564Y985_HYMDI|nr:unnamed protein product [Hymenolepis diminuta]
MIRRSQISPQKRNLTQSSSILLIENTPKDLRLLSMIPTLFKERSSTARLGTYQSSTRDEQGEIRTLRNLE